MSKKKVEDAVGEFLDWLPNFEPKQAQGMFELVARMLASVPGGEELEDLGYEPYDFIGWKEMDMITNIFAAIEDKRDVEQAAEMMLHSDDEDEDEEDDY